MSNVLLNFDALQLGPRNANLFSLVALREALLHVRVVVLDDAEDDVARRDALSPIGALEFTGRLDLCIDVILTDTSVGQIVVCHKIDVVLINEVERDYPGAGADNLVDPLAVSQDVDSLSLRHNDLALLLCGFFITRNSHYEVNIWKELLCLLEDLGVTDVEDVEDTVSIDAGWPVF